MKHPKIITTSAFSALFIAGAIFFWGTAGTALAHAATTAVSTTGDGCGITSDDIAQIRKIQNDPALSYSDEIKQELALRKALVAETIVCSQKEAQDLRANLATTTVENDMQSLQSQLIGDINETTGYYNAESSKLNLVGIAGTEAIAQEMFLWRGSTFTPLSENVNNLILWTQNQNLFNTAQARMAQTQRAVSFLESASPNPGLQTALNDAQSLFDTAQSQNAAAKSALTEGFSPAQSLSLIKQSLDSLSATYQGFFNVSKLISSALPQ
jgi:hypothetical protein